MMHRLIQESIHKLKNNLVTLRFSILAIFISLFFAAILSVMTISYIRFSHSVTKISLQFMQQASSTVLHKIKEDELNAAAREVNFTAELIQNNSLDKNNVAQIISYSVDMLRLRNIPIVQSIAWADTQGNIIYSQKQLNNTILTMWVNHSPKGRAQLKTIYHNLSGDPIRSSIQQPFHIDPRQRPWYIAAKQEKRLIWSHIYSFWSPDGDVLGISVAKPVFSQTGEFYGVVVIDIRLDYLTRFISTIKISPQGFVFIVADDGRLVAFPDLAFSPDLSLRNMHSLSQDWIIKSFEEYKKTGRTEFNFLQNKKNYLATYQPIPEFGNHHWLIGVVAPDSDFVGQLRKTNLRIMSISLFILILGIILVSALITRVVNPLKKLTLEADKIKNFELEETPLIYSKIKEINFLANAIYAMKKGLRLFQKYVPASLVRQLIEAGEEAHIGGAKKQLVVFFTDIKDFTTLAEHIHPDQLIELVCEYFEEISKIIVAHKGTIDKYIGDSIMAFWGAPLPENEPCQQAARTAICCVRRLITLNKKWEEKGKLTLFTRVGIHMGNAIVGNVGSSERLNYTAIGDTINIGSRLESVNKLYGTQILVSEIVYKTLQDQFVLRMVDCVTLKGKAEAGYIFELLAEHRVDILFDLDNYHFIYASAFSSYRQGYWDKAITRFSDCLEIFPADTVAPVMIKRCEHFKLNPPGEGWDGVWHISEKFL